MTGFGCSVLIGVRNSHGVCRLEERPVYSRRIINTGNKKDFFYMYERSLRVFWRLEELDLPNDLPVKDQQHVADHPEHEDLNADHDEKYR